VGKTWHFIFKPNEIKKIKKKATKNYKQKENDRVASRKALSFVA
jgi:hypothetical protein